MNEDAKKKILVVEDDNILRDILVKKLENSGFTTISAIDGTTAMTLMRSELPDLVLLDMLLPNKSGLEIMQEMRNDPALKNILVIAISNSGEATEIEKAKELGAKDFLIKAIFDSNDVLNRVNKVFNISNTPQQMNSEQTSKVEPEITAPPTPVDEPTPVPPVASTPAPQSSTATSSSKPNAKKVMIIEDDKFLRELAVQKLAHEGFEVYGAYNGQEAFAQLQTVKPHVIILDLILPGMDGYEVLAKLKADATTMNIPVIILSNLGQTEDIERAKKLGAYDFMVKAHFSFGEIVKKINTVLQTIG